MPKYKFYIPAEVVLDVKEPKEKEIREAAVKASKGHPHPHRFQEKIMRGFRKNRFTEVK